MDPNGIMEFRYIDKLNPVNFESTINEVPTMFDLSEISKQRLIEDLRRLAFQMEGESRMAFLTCFLRLRYAPWNRDAILYDLELMLIEEVAEKYLKIFFKLLERHADQINDFARLGFLIQLFIMFCFGNGCYRYPFTVEMDLAINLDVGAETLHMLNETERAIQLADRLIEQRMRALPEDPNRDNLLYLIHEDEPAEMDQFNRLIETFDDLDRSWSILKRMYQQIATVFLIARMEHFLNTNPNPYRRRTRVGGQYAIMMDYFENQEQDLLEELNDKYDKMFPFFRAS